MLRADIIELSDGVYTSPVFLVPKKDSSFRMVVDYRKLNQQTIPENFPMQNITDSLQALGSNHPTIFSTLDMQSGYHQIPIKKSARKFTGFIMPDNVYQFKRAPFGLTNCPFVFSKLMSKVLAGLQGQILLVFIDDIIAFSPTFEQHLLDLKTIFDRLQQANLSLKPSKCEFGKDKIKFLGHEVLAKGISPFDDDKIKIINDAQPPTTVKGVRQFLGLAGYYRKHILNFSKIAAPLTDLTKGVIKSKPITWNPECQKAFDTLKYALTHAPILVYPNYSQPFILTTDASNYATWAILSQIHDKKEVVIAYGGRKLSQAEQTYTTTERECLAVIEGLREFEPYIRGRSVKILTDHANLKWILTQKQPPGRLARWLAYLQSFSFQVEHRSGSKIPHADAISRQFMGTDIHTEDHRKNSHI
jgi:hypothetical protein